MSTLGSSQSTPTTANTGLLGGLVAANRQNTVNSLYVGGKGPNTGVTDPTPQPTVAFSAPKTTTQNATKSVTIPTMQQNAPAATPPVTSAYTPVATPTQQQRGLFSNVMQSLVRSAQPSEEYNRAQAEYSGAVKNLEDLRKGYADEQAGIATSRTPMRFQTGASEALAKKFGAYESAAATRAQQAGEAVGRATTQQLAEQQALGTVAGLAPEALRYEAFSGSGAGGQFSPETASQEYAKEVASGVRTYNDAVAAMGLYGDAGKQFLDQAIRSVNPNFNFAQAQALQSTQGTVAPKLEMAGQALLNLKNTFDQTPGWQKSSIPVINSLTNALASVGLGTGSATAKANALAEARTQVANAIGAATNSTPTTYDSLVRGWFPDNATPEQVAAGIQQFQNLATSRQGTFGTPGSVQPFSGALPNSAQTADGGAWPGF